MPKSGEAAQVHPRIYANLRKEFRAIVLGIAVLSLLLIHGKSIVVWSVSMWRSQSSLRVLAHKPILEALQYTLCLQSETCTALPYTEIRRAEL
jgi:hypothetical protein